MAVASCDATHRVPRRSSASSPKVDRLPCSPGFTKGVATATPPAILRTPPSAMLLTNSVPSARDVTLSGKRPVSGSRIAVGPSAADAGKAAQAIASDSAGIPTACWAVLMRNMARPLRSPGGGGGSGPERLAEAAEAKRSLESDRQAASSASAMPWPPPMQSVTSPRRMPSRLHRMEQARRQHRAGRADRMAVGDGAALDIDDVLGQAELLARRPAARRRRPR